jgi:hypothetical protein
MSQITIEQFFNTPTFKEARLAAIKGGKKELYFYMKLSQLVFEEVLKRG